MRGRLNQLLIAAAALSVAAIGVRAQTPDQLLVMLQGGSQFLPGAGIDLNFATGQGFQQGIGVLPATALIAVSRASPETNLLPTSAAGASYQSFGNNIAAVIPGSGLLVYESRTNYLLNSTAPATQTTASLTAGTYTLWINGSGSATPSAGTATGCTGFAAATQGNPDTFACTGNGTITVTVSGSLNEFQLEGGPFGTPFIVTAGATATRAADVPTVIHVPVFGGAYSMFASGTPAAPTSDSSNQYMLQISDGTILNRVGLLRLNISNVPSWSNIVGGVAQSAPTAAAAWPANTTYKLAYSLIPGSQQAAALNGTALTAAAVTPILISQINIGTRSDGGVPFNGTIARVALWPTTAQSASFLQQITGGSAP